MSELMEILTSYVPGLIARHLAQDPTPIRAPMAHRLPAAVLFADISGFTALAERLAERGPVGAEELSILLNRFFGELIDVIDTHGGDIYKFAGDGLIALWPAADESGVPPEEQLAAATHRAAQCSLVAQKRLNNYQVAPGQTLSMKLALGAGTAITVQVGGDMGRWEFLVTGAPLVQVGQASQHAHPGDIIISPEAWRLIAGVAAGRPPLPPPTPLQPISSRQTPFTRLVSLQRPLPLPQKSGPPPPLPAAAAAGLRAFIPGSILSRLDAGQYGWLAELRRVTTMFINLPGLHYTMPLEQAQTIMLTLQKALYRFEGSINKLGVDEKGVMLIAATGLPPLAHEDDPARCVQAALVIQAELKQLGLRGAIGLTTGRAFCGAVGNHLRREYTMHGDVVNLAARLMQAAPGTILCDTATYLAARDTMAFEELPPITVKGKTGQIAVYRPVGRHQAAPRRQTELVDRAPERAYMLAWLQNLQQNRSGAAVIQGEAGIGKTRLVADLLQKARAAGITVFTGSGGAIDRSTPYYAWRPVFRQLFKLDSQADDPADQRAWVLEKLQTMPPGQTGESTPANWLQLAPLLNPVLPLDWPENELTRHMTGKVRADNTQDLLLYLLQHTAALPAVIVLDDAHWLDSASWALAALTVQRVSPVLLLIVTRPIAHPVPTEYTQLRQAARTSYFHLNGLSNEDTVALVCRRLEVNSLPESLARLVQLKTEGNPFFGEELAYALRDNGIVHIENGECRLVNPNNHAETLHLPDTVQGVITSRIDRLAPGQQLTLKVASVIGRAFEYDTLHHIHPIEADKPHLTTHLSTLDRLEITQLENPPPDLAYIFKQLTTQEVAYNMLLFSQRRELHRAVAQWYEQTYPDALTPYYALLAYHWQVAESFDKAIVYMEKAGEQALHNYANEEAVEFFSQAIAVATEKETGVTHLQLAHWETKLGEAYINWAKLTDGRTHLEQGLALLGYPVPDNVAGKAMILTLQLGRQWLHRVWPHHFLGRQAARQDTLLPASRAYEGLTAVYYFANDTLLTLVAALRSLNLAEAAGPSPELARGSASVGVIVSFIPLHGLAQTYLQRALAMIRRFDDPPALAWVSLLGGVYYAGVGHWTEAQNLFEEGMALAERLGDHSRWHDAIGNLAMLHYFHSRFQQSAALFDDMLASTIRRRDAHNQAWALRGQVYCLILHGDFTEALHRLETLQTLLSQNPHIVDEALNIDLYGLLALVYLHLDRPEEAYQAVTQALTLMAKVSPTSFLSLPSYAAIAETCLLLWENNFAPAQGNGQPKAMARRALKGLRAYARVFPIGRPQARLWQGVFEWQAGRATRAEKLWAAAIESARTLHMSYLHAIACHQIARRLPFTDPMGEQYRRTAEKILAGLHLPPPADPAED